MHEQPFASQVAHSQALAPLVATAVAAAVAQHASVPFANEPAKEGMAAAEAVAVEQPQLPHSQASHEQTPPVQSGHLQSTQPQAELDFGFAELRPTSANANVNVRPKARIKNAAETAKLFMVKLQN